MKRINQKVNMLCVKEGKLGRSVSTELGGRRRVLEVFGGNVAFR